MPSDDAAPIRQGERGNLLLPTILLGGVAEKSAGEVSGRKRPLIHWGSANTFPQHYPGVAKTADAAYSKHALWRFESSPLDRGILLVQKDLPTSEAIKNNPNIFVRKILFDSENGRCWLVG